MITIVIYRGTTPTLTIEFEEAIPVTSLVQIWVTISGLKGEFEERFEIDDFELDSENNSIYMTLTQEQTLALPKKKSVEAVCEIRMLDDYGVAYICDNTSVTIHGDLKRDGVIS